MQRLLLFVLFFFFCILLDLAKLAVIANNFKWICLLRSSET